MVDLPVLLEDADLRRRYGAVTLERAWDYVRTGRVLSDHHEVDTDGDLDIHGTVSGATAVPYTTYVAVGQGERGLWVHSRCSCPVAESCKHALALLITVRHAQEQVPAWVEHVRGYARGELAVRSLGMLGVCACERGARLPHGRDPA